MGRESGQGRVAGEPDWRSVWGAERLGWGAGEGTTSPGDHRAPPGWFLPGTTLPLSSCFHLSFFPPWDKYPHHCPVGPVGQREGIEDPTRLLLWRNHSFCPQSQPPLGLNAGQRAPTVSQPSPAWPLAVVSSFPLSPQALRTAEIQQALSTENSLTFPVRSSLRTWATKTPGALSLPSSTPVPFPQHCSHSRLSSSAWNTFPKSPHVWNRAAMTCQQQRQVSDSWFQEAPYKNQDKI